MASGALSASPDPGDRPPLLARSLDTGALLRLLVRLRYLVLGLSYVLGAVFLAPDGPPFDLHYLREGAAALRGDGVHLYARHPELQIGPLSLLAALLIGPLPTLLAYHLLALAALLLLAVSIERLAEAATPGSAAAPRRQQALLAAAPVLGVGAVDVFVRWGHIDDLLALAALAAALSLARRGAASAGLVLALALACKPWALVGIVGLAALPTPRARVRACALLLAGSCLAYLPFLLGDLSTLSALAEFQIRPQDDSLPALLGRDAPLPATRVLQLLLATVLGVIALRWAPAALLALVVGARLLLDAGTFEYYTLPLLAGLAVFESSRAPTSRAARFAWRTWTAWLLLNWNPYLLPFSPGLSRLLVLGALLGSLLPWRAALSRRTLRPPRCEV